LVMGDPMDDLIEAAMVNNGELVIVYDRALQLFIGKRSFLGAQVATDVPLGSSPYFGGTILWTGEEYQYAYTPAGGAEVRIARLDANLASMPDLVPVPAAMNATSPQLVLADGNRWLAWAEMPPSRLSLFRVDTQGNLGGGRTLTDAAAQFQGLQLAGDAVPLLA